LTDLTAIAGCFFTTYKVIEIQNYKIKIQNMVYFLIALFIFIFAGCAKGLADRISWSDLFGKFNFLSREKTGEKDKNHDGKVSVQEKYFPFDGWHLMEWFRVLPFAFLSAYFIAEKFPFQEIFWLNYTAIVILLAGFYNFAFLIVYGLLPRINNK
jgi:hypothetical protein